MYHSYIFGLYARKTTKYSRQKISKNIYLTSLQELHPRFSLGSGVVATEVVLSEL